jgi:site-specific DNA-methyltransferase (adenine-specific)
MLTSGLTSSNRSDWETPDELFAELDREFGFTVDVCAGPENAKLGRYWSKSSDGLKQDWAGERCWMNPPYGREISAWMRKAYSSRDSAECVVCLVPARTDTAWWHDYTRGAEVRFIRGRVRFKGGTSSAPFPSALVIFRKGGNK